MIALKNREFRSKVDQLEHTLFANEKVPSLMAATAVLVSAPTILKLSNIGKRIPPDMQGLNITRVLKDPTKKVRESCLIEVDEADINMGYLGSRVKYLITENYSLTIYNGLKEHGDIYDRVNDTLQLTATTCPAKITI